MASRTAFPGTINSGDVVSSTNNNHLPGGKIGRVTVTSNSAGTTTVETIASVTVSVGANREIEIVATGNVRASATNGMGAQAAISLSGTGQIQRRNFWVNAPATDTSYSIRATVQSTTATSMTFSLLTGASGAGGTVTTIADDGTGTHGSTILEVFDCGPSF